MDNWPFWMFEENVKLVNEILEEEETNRKKQEDEQQKTMGGFDTGSMMSNVSNMTNNMNMNIPK